MFREQYENLKLHSREFDSKSTKHQLIHHN